MARQRDKTYFVQRFKPPRIVVSSNEFLVFVIHRNERQLRSLRRLLDGSEFSVKAVEYPEPALPGYYVMGVKLRAANEGKKG